MGLFSFIKGAGEKLFGGKAHADESQSNETSVNGIIEYINKMALNIKDLAVTFDKETATATVKGEAADVETKEKVILCVGNVAGVENVNDEMTVAAAAVASEAATATAATVEASQFYQVKSGDTLSKIAKDYYGDANKYPVIFEANKPMLSHPDKIYPGQTLRIPKI